MHYAVMQDVDALCLGGKVRACIRWFFDRGTRDYDPD